MQSRDSDKNLRSMLRPCFGEAYEESGVSLACQKVQIVDI